MIRVPPLVPLVVLLLGGCTYEGDPDPRPTQTTTPLEIIKYAPSPGETGVSRAAWVDLVFNAPPDGAHVSSAYLRLFSGLYETIGTHKVDLLKRRIRFSPTTALRGELRYEFYVSARIRGINGSTLADNVFFDFTTGAGSQAPPATTPPAVTARKVQDIWAARCTSCHGAEAPPARVDLSTAAAALRSLKGVPSMGANRPRVVPGDHARSYLMLKLLDVGGVTGFVMPPSGPALTATQLRQVADWIDGGALP